MSDKAKDLFGSELADPFQAKNGTLKTVSGIEALEQSVKAIVLTEKGELVMRPDYGWPLMSGHIHKLASKLSRQ